MSWRPVLNVVCGRCGKPRGLTHVCISGRARKATAKPQFSFGTCPKCKKPQGNPLTHTCHPRSDFKRRRTVHHKQQATDKRAQAASVAKVGRSRHPGPKKAKHDYLTCTDNDCQRPLCVAFKTGYRTGHREGYELGWHQGYDRGFRDGYNRGFPDGIAACPRSHK